MCKFFSAISDGNGKTLFFKVEDIAKEMASCNPKSYEWNSHTSISHYFDIPATEEGKWNFWEYDTNKKELRLDVKNNNDDNVQVKIEIEKYLEGKNIEWLLNFYNRNSGNRNSGNGNSGNRNSGDWNSGNGNSGNGNSGNRNSGDWNSGNGNSGYGNSGNGNSGNRNSGYWNSGYGNSGNRNSGYWNSGEGAINSLCDKDTYLLFNKICSIKDFEFFCEIYNKINFNPVDWISENNMTNEEKEANSTYKTTGGYLKKYEYKEAWKNAFEELKKNGKYDEVVKQIKKLKNYNSKIFFNITGVKI